MPLNLRTHGLMLILSSPSGGGKSSLANSLLKIEQDIVLSVSITTREMRQGEVDGENYHFKTREEFENLIKTDALLEHTTIYSNYYGTLKTEVSDILAKGSDVLFDVDHHGAKIIKAQNPDEVVTVFILPPSLETLKQRIIQRAKDSNDVIERRLQLAPDEMKHAPEYDYVIVNDDFDLSLAKIQSILNAERSKTKRLENLHDFLKI